MIFLDIGEDNNIVIFTKIFGAVLVQLQVNIIQMFLKM